MFQGIITALITPFRQNKVDDTAFKNLVNWQIENGIRGLVIGGTTGESPLLSEAEQFHLWAMAVDTAAGRVPIIAGTGAIGIDETIHRTRLAKEVGCQGALIITPPYVKPSQESLYLFFKSIHDAVDIPIILYNNPSRTGVEISRETVLKTAQLKNIVGIKDATGDFERVTYFRSQLPSTFMVLGGDDVFYPAFRAMGGDGLISSASNIVPHLFLALDHAWRLGDMNEWARVRDLLYPLIKALSVAANPFPQKFAASLLGNVSTESRLPFAPLDAHACEEIRSALKIAGVWNESPTLHVAPA